MQHEGGHANGKADPYQPYRKQLLSPQRVRELSQLRPWRPVVDALLAWGMILACWALVAWQPRWWVALLVAPIIGARYYALLIIGHDGLHRRSFQRPWWNDLFNDLAVFGPIAAVTRINNANHLRHHHFLSTPADPDLHQFSCANKYRWPLLLGYLTGLSSVAKSVRKVFFDRMPAAAAQATPSAEAVAFPDPGERSASEGNTGPQRYTLRDLAIIGVWQAALIGGLSWGVGWWAWPALWLAPIYLFAFLPDNFRAFAEHSHPEPDAQADRHRLISFLSHPLERFFVAPHNMNYHAAHHLWPSIPYYHLAQADREIRDLPQAAGLEWRGWYLVYLARYWRLLPLRECEPNAAAPPAQPA